MQLKDKVAVISGVGSRFGGAAARLFAQEGAKVILVSRKEEIIKGLTEEITKQGWKADYRVLDATIAEQVKSAIDSIAKEHGKIDVLFNNAGGSYTKREKLAEMGEDFWDATLRNNLKTNYLMSKHVIEHMKKSGGSIINVGAAFKTMLDGNSAYATAKGGIIGLTKNLAREVREHNIRVNCIMPGVVRNDSNTINLKNQPPSVKRKGNSEDVAHAALYFASDASSWVTGQTLVVDGGEELHLGID